MKTIIFVVFRFYGLLIYYLFLKFIVFFLIETYNSCKQVSVPSTGQLAIDLMCGSWGSRSCTAKRWFDFMGDIVNNPYTPFQINYKNTSVPVGSYTPIDPGTTPCSVALSVSIIKFQFEVVLHYFFL